ncbi:type IV secretion system protein VirB10 [Aliirhizobium smilacinae]|uniref:TrbI/VirB10 family protein n=1 Tax=Aliirhizobium smilacinae TaxID=1395944 RepID=A0A5C4XRY1_9HYPH|nr:type IV secretion system protein VirB10 [Rhizobium smilacinae]TNM65310.1 TrbI/VirB10 family protein [Rhizobium smilacinae]
MSLSPELKALQAEDDVRVADRTIPRNQRLAMATLFVGGVIAAYLVLSASAEQPVDNLQSDEEFKTSLFRPPSFMRQEKVKAQAEPSVIKIPPPPAEPEPVTETIEVPPPPSAIPELAAIDEFPDRFRSKLLSLDQGGARGGQTGEQTAQAGSVVAGEDKASRYLESASRLSDRNAKARHIGRIDAVIAEGTLIPGIIETAVNSDLPGQIRAVTAEDVYSFDGRRVLIPTGTRLIGEYQSEITRGQKRIFVVWTRLIRNDGVTVRLNSIGSDNLGRSGLTGHIDNKFRERFGAAIMLSIVGAGASYLTGYGSDAATGDSEDAERAKELARETIARTFSTMANTVLSENLKIQPTINIAQGERIFVYVRQDLDFSAFYDDPVVEAMKEIRRERQGK